MSAAIYKIHFTSSNRIRKTSMDATGNREANQNPRKEVAVEDGQTTKSTVNLKSRNGRTIDEFDHAKRRHHGRITAGTF